MPLTRLALRGPGPAGCAAARLAALLPGGSSPSARGEALPWARWRRSPAGEQEPGGRSGAARGPRGARPHSPRSPARRARWPLSPALGTSPGLVGQRLRWGPAGRLVARGWRRGAPPAAGGVERERGRGSAFCQSPAPLRHRHRHPRAPSVLPREAAQSPLCGGAGKGSAAPRSFQAPVAPRPPRCRGLACARAKRRAARRAPR